MPFRVELKQYSKLDKFQILYRDLDQIQEQSFARFNYRERMKLERTLFILLNEILSFQ